MLAPQGSGYVGDRGPDFLLASDRWSQILNLQLRPRRPGVHDRLVRHERSAITANVDGHDRTNGRIFKVVLRRDASRCRSI